MKRKIRRMLEREAAKVMKESGVRDILKNPAVRQAVLDAAGYGSKEGAVFTNKPKPDQSGSERQ